MARRSGTDRRKAESLAKALTSMFRRLERRPAPDALLDVVDQLDGGASPTKSKPGPKATGRR